MHCRPEILRQMPLASNRIYFLMKQMLQMFLGKWFEHMLLFELEENEFVAKLGTREEEAEISRKLQNLQGILENQTDQMFFTVVQSPFFQQRDSLSEIYQQVLQASQYAFVQQTNQFIMQSEIETIPLVNVSFSAEQEKRLYQAVHEGEVSQARALTEEVLRSNLEPGIRRIHLVILCNRLINTLMQEMPQTCTEFSKASGTKNIYEQVLACDTPEEYLDLLCTFAAHTAEWVHGSVQQCDPVIKSTKDFLEKNYSREFSMDELAESVKLSKSYLSTYFKLKTGINLSSYIQQTRMRKAVVLLEETDMHINDISAAVGINNANTFIRAFRKHMGLAPSEYRKQQLKLK